jgi:hypothetical protein
MVWGRVRVEAGVGTFRAKDDDLKLRFVGFHDLRLMLD